ncbi:MAG: hypothetical protein ACI8YQ_003541 [Polaribacter sp.]|jgi:hypothetical protein
MFGFFKNDKDKRIKNNIQLVSIHIPKTAGTSFRNTLREVYGEQQVKRLDVDPNKLHLEQELFQSNKLAKEIEVVHGHMYYNLLYDKFKIAPEVPIVTWLRDPVERVISNYKYLSKRLAEELDEEGKGLNILSKMQRTLMEYAHDEMNRNRMSKFLEGLEPEDLYFIGISDYYSEDLKDLADLLGWKNVEEHRLNVTGKRVDDVSQNDRAAIRELNNLDVDLYQKAIQLREQRKNS